MLKARANDHRVIVATLEHAGAVWETHKVEMQISAEMLLVLREHCVHMCKLPCRCKQIPWAFGYVYAFKFSDGTVWDCDNGWRVKPVKLRLENDLPAEPDRALAMQQLADAYLQFMQQRIVCAAQGLHAVVDGFTLIIEDNQTDKLTKFRCDP